MIVLADDGQVWRAVAVQARMVVASTIFIWQWQSDTLTIVGKWLEEVVPIDRIMLG